MGTLFSISTLNNVLIDTWWNVNTNCAAWAETFSSFNRYMVECKAMKKLKQSSESQY